MKIDIYFRDSHVEALHFDEVGLKIGVNQFGFVVVTDREGEAKAMLNPQAIASILEPSGADKVLV